MSRFELPRGFQSIAAREDGRYLFCYPSKAWGNRSHTKLNQRIKVVDAETGVTVSEFALTLSRYSSAFYWMEDQRVVITAADRLYVIDYLTGKILQDTKLEQTNVGNGTATEDGKSLYTIRGGGKERTITAYLTDLQTGRVTKVGEVMRPSFIGNSGGLIPGGKYFYTGPGMCIIDRDTFELVAQKKWKGTDLLRTTFSNDGSKYATVTRRRVHDRDNSQPYDPMTQSTVRIQETLSGKTIWAALAPTRWCEDLVLSHDGKRLGIVTDEGEIVVWSLRE